VTKRDLDFERLGVEDAPQNDASGTALATVKLGDKCVDHHADASCV
jgi:hypothetical protein